MEQCTHQRTEIRRRTIANGVKILQRQCLDCGASVGNALSQQKMSVEERHAFSLWDEELFNRIEVERKAEWEKLRAASMAEEEEKDAAWWAGHSAYLATPEWKEKHDAVLKRDGYLCQGCLNARATIAHHLTYKHHKNELLFELVAVCDHCHARCHPGKDMRR